MENRRAHEAGMTVRRLAIVVVLLTVIGAWSSEPARAAAATYYVAANGDDSNPGTADRPFRTIQAGLDVAKAGDTVRVGPGDYSRSTFPRSGSTAAPITLRAELPATETAEGSKHTVIDCGDGRRSGLRLHYRDNITIDGFRITDCSVGVSIDGTGQNIRVRHSILDRNTAVGIQCWECVNGVFSHNRYLDYGDTYENVPVTAQDYGINFYHGSGNRVLDSSFRGKHHQALSIKENERNTFIARNSFEGCMYTCVYAGQNDDDYPGGPGDHTSVGAIIRDNTFTDATNPRTGAYQRLVHPIVLRNVKNATATNNTISRALGPGVNVFRCDRARDTCRKLGLQPVAATIRGNRISTPGPGSVQKGVEIYDRGYAANESIAVTGNTILDHACGFSRPPSSRPWLSIHDNTLIRVRNTYCW